MVWYDEPMTEGISNNLYCYCELLIEANDLMLQGFLNQTVDNSWTLSIEAYESDGTTLIANITTSFAYLFAHDNFNNPYFNAKLLNFPAVLCGNCFILHVVISRGNTRAFDQWTDLYCIANCCQIVRGTVIKTEDGSVIDYGSDPLPVIANSINEKCSRQIVRIEGIYDCNDNFGGGYFGEPHDMSGGNSSGFNFRRVANIAATFQRGKREITKEISFNCHTQKVTSVKNYDLQSFEVFPAWKAEELEDLLCAPYISINGEIYLYYGGEDPFTVLNPKSCTYQYRFRATFRDCAIWQIFGCDSVCSNVLTRYFGFLKQSNAYFNENGRKIGINISDVEAYLRSQNGTFNVQELTPPIGTGEGQVRANYYKIIKVQSRGVIPSYIYFDRVGINTKVFGMQLDEVNPDFNSLFNVSSCPMPMMGTPTFTSEICNTPVIGVPTFTNTTSINGKVNSFQEWTVNEDDSNSVVRVDNQVTISFTTRNAGMFTTPENPAFINTIVGYVTTEFAPSISRQINSDMNDSLPEGDFVVIDTNGAISYFGQSEPSDIATKTFTNLRYLL